MFFVRSILVLLMIQLAPRARANPMSVDTCMNAALKEATKSGLGPVLYRYLDVQTIAATAVWQRWRVHWRTMSITGKKVVLGKIQSLYDSIGSRAFRSIKLDTVHWQVISETNSTYQIAGHYDLASSNVTGKSDRVERDTFGLLMNFTEHRSCKVTKFSWNNASFTAYVTSKLPKDEPR